jgi:hypothetical protein
MHILVGVGKRLPYQLGVMADIYSAKYRDTQAVILCTLIMANPKPEQSSVMLPFVYNLHILPEV